MAVKMMIAPANVNSFKSLFNSIESVIDSITFECYKDRVEINSLDKSKTIFMNIILENSYFEEYICEESDRFTLDVVNLKKILKSCKDELIIEFDEFYCNIKSKTKKFQLVQSGEDFASQKPADFQLYAQASIPIKYLKSMIKDIELFAADVIINVSDNQFTFTTDGVMGKFTDTYTVNESFNNQSVKVRTEKFNICLGADKVSDEMELDIGTDMPLIIRVQNEGIFVKYMIAPVIDMSD